MMHWTRPPWLRAVAEHAQTRTAAGVFLYVILSGILSALYLFWVKRASAGSAPSETTKPVEA